MLIKENNTSEHRMMTEGFEKKEKSFSKSDLICMNDNSDYKND